MNENVNDNKIVCRCGNKTAYFTKLLIEWMESSFLAL